MMAPLHKNTVEVKVGGHITSALVDSGAGVTIMDKAYFDKTNFSDSKLDPPDFESITGVGGHKSLVLGKMNMEFVMRGARYTYMVHVVKGLHHSFILGIDFLSAFNVRIFFSEQNTLEIPDGSEPKVCVIKTSAG